MLSYPEIRVDMLKVEADDTRLGEALSMLNREARKCLENGTWNEVSTYCKLARELYDELWINGIDPAHAEAIFHVYEGISYLYQAEKKAGEPEESTELAKAIDCLEKSQRSFSGYSDQWNEIILDLNLGRLYRSQNRLNEALLAFERSRTFSNLNGLSDEKIEEIVKVVSEEIEKTRRLFDGQKLFAPHVPEELPLPAQPKVTPLRILSVIDEIAAGKEKPTSDDITGYIQQTDELEFEIEGQELEVKLLKGTRPSFFLPGYDYVAVLVSGDSMDEAGIAPNDYVILRKPIDVPLRPSSGDIVAVVFRDEDAKATLKRIHIGSDKMLLKPESSNPAHKPRTLLPEAFAGDNPPVKLVGVAIAVLKPQIQKVIPFRVFPIIDEIAAGKERPVSDDITGYIQQTDELEFEIEGQTLEVEPLRGSQLESFPGYDYVALQVAGDSMDQAGIAPNDYVILRKPKEVPLRPSSGDVVAVVFRDEDNKATLKRIYIEPDRVILKPESSNPEHQPRVLQLEVFAGDNPPVAVVGTAIAVLKPKPVLKPRPHTEVQQRRFTDVHFPERCKIHQSVRLSIQLTLRPVHGVLPPSEVILDPTTREVKERQVELIVFVSADSFQIDRRWRKLSVPFGQDSEKVEFELIGQKLGIQIIEIEFFHGTARVGYIVVETRVVDGYTSGQDRQAVMENPCVAIDDRAFPGTQQQPDVGIRVHWRKGEEIEYSIQREWWQQVDFSMPLAQSEEKVIALWEDLSGMMGKAVRLSGLSKNGLYSIQLHVKGLGRLLCRYLLPPELQRYSSTWPVGSVVSISTNEHWIPWELIHDGDDFWGNKFILARLPRRPAASAFSASDGTMKRNASTQLRKIVNVIGGGLKPPIVERVRKLFTTLGPHIPIEPPVERATLAEVLRSIADADIIHFTCHGHTAPRPCLQIADDRSPTPCLTPSDLENLLELTGSLIFANACASAVVTSFLGELCNFGWEFYKRGAVAYIGTLGLVPAEYAVAFAERFYERFLNGHTVGESLRYAKSKAERENPFWLLYTLYGRPFARKHIQP